jgi:hypothetical protein
MATGQKNAGSNLWVVKAMCAALITIFLEEKNETNS